MGVLPRNWQAARGLMINWARTEARGLDMVPKPRPLSAPARHITSAFLDLFRQPHHTNTKQKHITCTQHTHFIHAYTHAPTPEPLTQTLNPEPPPTFFLTTALSSCRNQHARMLAAAAERGEGNMVCDGVFGASAFALSARGVEHAHAQELAFPPLVTCTQNLYIMCVGGGCGWV